MTATRSRMSGLVRALTELAAGHPLDEGVAALLMVALHRCGLRGAALAVYADTRRHLVRELGVEPGDALRRAHQELLGESGSVPAECAGTTGTASGRLRLVG